jgi:hypothetical protein
MAQPSPDAPLPACLEREHGPSPTVPDSGLLEVVGPAQPDLDNFKCQASPVPRTPIVTGSRPVSSEDFELQIKG